MFKIIKKIIYIFFLIINLFYWITTCSEIDGGKRSSGIITRNRKIKTMSLGWFFFRFFFLSIFHFSISESSIFEILTPNVIVGKSFNWKMKKRENKYLYLWHLKVFVITQLYRPLDEEYKAEKLAKKKNKEL